FIVGPIEDEAGRPVVNFKEIAFDPTTKTFTLSYMDGSTGTLKLASIDENRMILDVDLGKPVGNDRSFAALRSMYVTEFNADVAKSRASLYSAACTTRSAVSRSTDTSCDTPRSAMVTPNRRFMRAMVMGLCVMTMKRVSVFVAMSCSRSQNRSTLASSSGAST